MGRVRIAYAAFQIVQLYAVLLHTGVAESDRTVTDTASGRGYALTLFTVSDTEFGEHPFSEFGE